MYRDARQPPTDICGYNPVATAGDCVYDAEAAEKVIQFFACCLTLTEGQWAGERFILQPWQAAYIRTMFGWKRPDGRRRYRSSYLGIPRKNGKTTFAAGIALYVLLCDGERRGQIYCAAGERVQASLVFDTAAAMLNGIKGFRKRCKVVECRKNISYKDSFMRAIPASEGAVHGYRPHLIVGDELHVWPNRRLYDGLRSGQGSGTQPLEVYITTAGWDRNSVCYEQYSYACQVRDGTVTDEAYLPAVYETSETEDWTDPAVWAKANPNFGVSVFEDFLQLECERAQINPALENTFRRLYLNQWTSQESRWLQMERWRDCNTTRGPIEDGAAAFGGLDLSSNVDVTAWLIAQPSGTGYKLQGHYFIPEGRMHEAERRDRVPYSRWIKDGWVTATPGDAIDYSYVHRKILQDCERLNVGAVGYDPWNAEPTRIHLENEGVTCVKMRQNVGTLSGPCKELERCVIEGVLDHRKDPVLAWMAENVQVKSDDNGNIRPVKPDHGGSAKRIDGIVAAVMAIGMAQLTEPETKSTGKVMFA